MAMAPPEVLIVVVLAASVEPRDRTELKPMLFLAVGLASQRALICCDFEKLFRFVFVLLLCVGVSCFFLKLDGIFEAEEAAKTRRLAMDDVLSIETSDPWRSRLEESHRGGLAGVWWKQRLQRREVGGTSGSLQAEDVDQLLQIVVGSWKDGENN
jgi:hypothetical protein